MGAIAGLTRDFSTPLGTPGTTRYASFLLRPEGTLQGGAFNGFFGVVFEQPLEPELYIGKPGAAAIDRYVLEDRGGALQVASMQLPQSARQFSWWLRHSLLPATINSRSM